MGIVHCVCNAFFFCFNFHGLACLLLVECDLYELPVCNEQKCKLVVLNRCKCAELAGCEVSQGLSLSFGVARVGEGMCLYDCVTLTICIVRDGTSN